MIKTLLLSLALMAGNPVDSLEEGVKLSQNKNFEASEVVLANVPTSEQNAKYRFYRLVNAYSLNNKKEAMKWADSFEYDFSHEPVPQRYRDLALIMKYDMETWKDEDKEHDLDDISREMKKAQHRLENKMGGPKTREIQKDVERRLKSMIDKIEDDQKKAMEAAQAELDKKQKQEVQPPPDTHQGQEQGTGKVDSRRVKEIAEVWGKLPEKERAKAMVELTRNMPAKDRAVIEAYFRELAKKSHK